LKSTFDCTKIYLSDYTGSNCENVYYKCEYDGTSLCKKKTCDKYTKDSGLASGTALTATDYAKC